MSERRKGYRREGDAQAYRLAEESERWRGLARRAVIAWAVGMTVAASALGLEVIQDREALHAAQSAVTKANDATDKSTTALTAVQHEALGLCRALDVGWGSTRADPSLRKIVHYSYLHAGRLLLSEPRSPQTQISRRLGQELIRGSRGVRYLPPIDCKALTHHPLTYQLPRSIPFK